MSNGPFPEPSSCRSPKHAQDFQQLPHLPLRGSWWPMVCLSKSTVGLSSSGLQFSALVSLQDMSSSTHVGEASSQGAQVPTCAPGTGGAGRSVLFGANKSRDQLPRWPSTGISGGLQECVALPCPDFLWLQIESPRGFPILPQPLCKQAPSSSLIPFSICCPARGSTAHSPWLGSKPL